MISYYGRDNGYEYFPKKKYPSSMMPNDFESGGIDVIQREFPLLTKFFSQEPALGIELLMSLKKENHYQFWIICSSMEGRGIFDTPNRFFNLLKYYATTPKLSLQLLFSYEIHDFTNISLDENLALHRWLDTHKLQIHPIKNFSTFVQMRSHSGLEYLSRKILSLPIEKRQNTLNNIMNSSYNHLDADQEKILADSLAPLPEQKKGCLVQDCQKRKTDEIHNMREHEYYECLPISYDLDIEERFLAFKQKEQEILKIQQTLTRHSLFWTSVKKIAQAIEEKKCSERLVPEGLKEIVDTARKLYSL